MFANDNHSSLDAVLIELDKIEDRVASTKRAAVADALITAGRFIVGKRYATRSICDYDCIHSFEILARTDRTVTVKVHGKTVRRGVRMSCGEECFSPFGRYSMSATIYANEMAMRLAETGHEG